MTSAQGYAEYVVPIDWWGSLEYGYNRAHYDSDKDSSGHMITAKLGNRSYIWYPWFATMKLGLGLTRSSSSGENFSNENSLVTGSADLNILPLSRFPLTLGYERSESRVDSSSFSSEEYLDYGSSNLSREKWRLNQRFLGKNYRLSLYHNQQRVSDEAGLEQKNIGNGIEYSLRGKGQHLELKALTSEADSRDGASTDQNLLSAHHTLTADNGINNNLLASRTETKQRFSNESGNDTHLTRIRQVANDTLWRSRDNKLTTNLGLRAYETESGNDAVTTDSEGTSASAGLSYRYSQRLQFNANGTYSLNKTAGEESYYRSGSLAANYSGKPIALGKNEYQYYVNGNAKRSDANGSQRSDDNLTGGHSLSRNFTLSKYSKLRISGSQTLTLSRTEVEGNEQSDSYAGHSLSLNWMKSTAGVNSYAQLSVNDQRSLQHEDNSQMLNLQLSRRQSLSRRASLGGNASYNWNARTNPSIGADYVTESAYALVDYDYQRPFQLQNIRFHSSLKHSINRASGGDTQSKTHFENRFQHHIGKLDSTLSLTYTQQNSVRYYLLWLRVKRSF